MTVERPAVSVARRACTNPATHAAHHDHGGTVNQLTDQQLDDIEARANAATEGPWMADGHEIYGSGCGVLDIEQWKAETLRIEDPEGAKADAEFIAHAREDVPALVETVRRLRAELTDQRAETQKLIRWHGEDETALKKMRGVVERLRAKLADQCAYEQRLREQHDLDVTELNRLRARVWELERPAVENQRNEVRDSFADLIAACRETKDYEGAFDVECRLREREEQWKAEDAAALEGR